MCTRNTQHTMACYGSMPLLNESRFGLAAKSHVCMHMITHRFVSRPRNRSPFLLNGALTAVVPFMGVASASPLATGGERGATQSTNRFGVIDHALNCK